MLSSKNKSVRKKRQNSSVSKPKLYPLSSEKPTQEKKPKSIYHAVGVMQTQQESNSYHNDRSMDVDLDKLEWLVKKVESVDNYTPYALGQVLNILDQYKERLKKKSEDSTLKKK